MIFYNSCPGAAGSFVKNKTMKQLIVFSCFLWGCFIAPAKAQETINTSTGKNKKKNMTPAQINRETIQTLYNDCLNEKDLAILPLLIDTGYTSTDGKKGVDAFIQPLQGLLKAFPDIRWTEVNLTADEKRVAVRWAWEGTHTAAFGSYAATGKKISVSGSAFYELKDGKITGSQVLPDRLGFLQSLGVLPADINAVARPRKEDEVNFIDKFFVPVAAKKEFYERMQFNRNLIKTLPGFIEDAAYEYTDDGGNLVCVTIARWKNREALNKAKEAVQSEYKKQGFDLPAMLQRLHIVADRGIYTAVKH